MHWKCSTDVKIIVHQTWTFAVNLINWLIGLLWITCGLLWRFYQLFGLLFWRHPAVQWIHWWPSDLMLHFSKYIPMKKQANRHLGWPKSEYIFSSFQLLFFKECGMEKSSWTVLKNTVSPFVFHEQKKVLWVCNSMRLNNVSSKCSFFGWTIPLMTMSVFILVD